MKLTQIQREKDDLLLQKQAAQAKLDVGKVKSFYKEEERRLKADLAQLAKDRDDAKKQRDKLRKEAVDIESEAKKTSIEMSDLEK